MLQISEPSFLSIFRCSRFGIARHPRVCGIARFLRWVIICLGAHLLKVYLQLAHLQVQQRLTLLSITDKIAINLKFICSCSCKSGTPFLFASIGWFQQSTSGLRVAVFVREPKRWINYVVICMPDYHPSYFVKKWTYYAALHVTTYFSLMFCHIVRRLMRRHSRKHSEYASSYLENGPSIELCLALEISMFFFKTTWSSINSTPVFANFWRHLPEEYLLFNSHSSSIVTGVRTKGRKRSCSPFAF